MAIDLRPVSTEERSLWLLALELSDKLPADGWTLIGAQMVLLHAAELGIESARTSRDLDLLVDVRAMATRPADVASTLLDLGFDLVPPTAEGLAHRFTRAADEVVDVLAPEGAGARARLTTVPPGRTLAVPGGTQALRRSQRVEVAVGARRGWVPRPRLIGAILLKARAAEVADGDKHLRDVALLLSGIADPRLLLAELSPTERRWLRAATGLLDGSHPAWQGIARAEDARLALSILLP